MAKKQISVSDAADDADKQRDDIAKKIEVFAEEAQAKIDSKSKPVEVEAEAKAEEIVEEPVAKPTVKKATKVAPKPKTKTIAITVDGEQADAPAPKKAKAAPDTKSDEDADAKIVGHKVDTLIASEAENADTDEPEDASEGESDMAKSVEVKKPESTSKIPVIAADDEAATDDVAEVAESGTTDQDPEADDQPDESAALVEEADTTSVEQDEDDSKEPEAVGPATTKQPDIEIDELEEDGEEPVKSALDETTETPLPVIGPTDISDAKVDRENELNESLRLKTLEKQRKVGFGTRLQNFFRSFWHNRIARSILILAVLGGISATALIPSPRYFMLNLVGVRVKASLRAVDSQTSQPLKNVYVTLNGQTSQTDLDGTVNFSKLKMGSTNVQIERRAFAKVNQSLVLGWGSNPLGDFRIVATGTTYKFKVTDWLSGKAVVKAEASAGDINAVSDPNGNISLVLDAASSDTPTVVLSHDGYRDEKFDSTLDTTKTAEVKMVSDRKHVFVSKRSGKYDLYKVDIDGKNEQLLLAGTGLERDDIALVENPASQVVALVSTRDNVKNKDGYLLSQLNLVDIATSKVTKVTQSEKIQLVDWYGDRLSYVAIAEGVSASNPKRHRLLSYNYKDNTNKEIATSNYFNDVLSAGGRIYYAPSNAFNENSNNAKLYSVNPDGSDQKTLINREVWNIFRADYDTLNIAAQQDWYSYKLISQTVASLSAAPNPIKSTLFIDNDSRSQSLWVDQRDGKTVLIEHDVKSSKDTILVTQDGIKSPFYWLNGNTVIYRVSNKDETADYVVSSDGGKAIKIRDVTSTGGIDKWYFY